MLDLTSFNRIESYYNNYVSICSQAQKESLIARGFLPNRLFVPMPNGDVVFHYWPLGSEDMAYEVIPVGSEVLCPSEWEQKLQRVNLSTVITTKSPLRNKGSILTYI
jgi:hypothetical protein